MLLKKRLFDKPAAPTGLGLNSLNALVMLLLSYAAIAIAGEPAHRTFNVQGVVRELQPANLTAVVAHEDIPNYMSAMTMPFKVRDAKELAGLQAGDRISFQLNVAESESWLDHIRKIGTVPRNVPKPHPPRSMAGRGTPPHHPLLDYHFTNELGQAIRISDFHGQSLAITFFFTRCPIPEYCPRLSKNFQEASQKLHALADAPTNWHFLSVSFDPGLDTPSVLKTYGERYHYDPSHWSFLTGPKDKISELTRLSGVEFEADGPLINHSFRTLIIDASGELQTSFPVSGDLTDAIVSEIRKAADVPNASLATAGLEPGASK